MQNESHGAGVSYWMMIAVELDKRPSRREAAHDYS